MSDQQPDHIPTPEGSRPALENTVPDAKIYLRLGRCSPKPKRSLLALLWVILASCGGAKLEPPAKPGAPRVLGLVEVSFDRIGRNLTASARKPNASPLRTQSLFDVRDGIQLEPISSSTFDVGKRDADGVRFLSATFKLRNASASGQPYTLERQNLSFVAALAPGAVGDTAVRVLEKFDGSSANPALALNVLPTHAISLNPLSDAPKVVNEAADFQAFTESDLAGLSQPDGVSLLPYGFVARCVSRCAPGSRRILASPAPDQFDGRVTFAVRVPLQADPKDDPFRLTLLFAVVDDDAARVTQSLEEQDDNSLVRARASSLTNSSLTALSGSSLPLSSICALRTAGPAASPTAFLVNNPALSSVPALANQMSVPQAGVIVTDFDRAMREADSSSLTVNGSITGRKPGRFSGANTSSLSFLPDPAALPGEQLEVTLSRALEDTRGARLCQPYTFRFRAGVAPSTAQFKASRVIGGVPQIGSPNQMVAADVNGDGRPDLLVVEDTGRVAVLLSQGDGSFTPGGKVGDTGGLSFSPPVAADFDGDGRLDLALLKASSGNPLLTILRGNGDGSFQPAREFPVGLFAQGMTVADVNSDGKLDVVFSTFGQSLFSVLLGNSDGSFQAPQLVSSGAFVPSFALTTADMNNDGRLDLIAIGRLGNTSEVAVLLGNGDGSFRTPILTAVGAGVFSVAVADLNQDGKLDIATVNFNAGSLSVLLGNGDGSLRQSQTLAIRFGPRALRIADLNGDGAPDLVAINTVPATASVLIGNGNGSFQAAREFAVSAAPLASLSSMSLETVDVNNDGKLDLVASDSSTGSIVVMTQQ